MLTTYMTMSTIKVHHFHLCEVTYMASIDREIFSMTAKEKKKKKKKKKKKRKKKLHAP